MVTVKQGKQIALLINGYDVYGMFVDKALREENNEDYARWNNRRDLQMVVLMQKYNIELPNAYSAFERLTLELGAEQLNKKIEWEYEGTVEFCKKA